jgi:hypothetical protein
MPPTAPTRAAFPKPSKPSQHKSHRSEATAARRHRRATLTTQMRSCEPPPQRLQDARPKRVGIVLCPPLRSRSGEDRHIAAAVVIEILDARAAAGAPRTPLHEPCGVSAAELPGLVNRAAVPRSDPLLEQMANRKCRPTTCGRKCRPHHWRRSIGRRRSPAWTSPASVEVANITITTATPPHAARQGRRNRNHRDRSTEKQFLHDALSRRSHPSRHRA